MIPKHAVATRLEEAVRTAAVAEQVSTARFTYWPWDFAGDRKGDTSGWLEIQPQGCVDHWSCDVYLYRMFGHVDVSLSVSLDLDSCGLPHIGRERVRLQGAARNSTDEALADGILAALVALKEKMEAQPARRVSWR